MYWAGAKRLASLTHLLLTFVACSIIAALCFAPSCANEDRQSANTRWGEIVATGKAQTPVLTGTFHGDVRAMFIQRRAVEAAFEDIERTSCGLVNIKIVWDFDPDNEMIYRVIKGDNLLMLTDSQTMIKQMGKEEGSQLLGLTRYSNSRWIFLVADKLDEDVLLWEWVTAHEIGHAIGMEHVNMGLMEPHAPAFVIDKAYWEREDIEEFCRQYDCQSEMFFDCRYR